MQSRGEAERVVKRRLADGSIKEYRYQKRRERRALYGPESVGALIIAYRRSPEWMRLADETKRSRTCYLRDLEELAKLPVAAVRRRDILALRDAIASSRGQGAAGVFQKVCGVVFGWARDHEWIENSPAYRIKKLPGGHLLAWTAEEADRAAAELPPTFSRVVTLARYTGQRRSDLIAMTWHAYDGTSIRLKQQKTGAELVIAVHPTLKAALDDWRRHTSSTHILVSGTGRPWQAIYLTHEFGRALAKLGMRPHLNLHGLRKLAAASLAEAGCSMHEIAAVTGHKSLAMVQLYTQSAEQERLARTAICRLQNANSKISENGQQVVDK